MTYDPSEMAEVNRLFAELLALPTHDGGAKRAAGTKVNWRFDRTHEAALFSHLNAWKHGILHDKDSGAHPLVHLAWRALALAVQDMDREELD
jgi:hypothetical protein